MGLPAVCPTCLQLLRELCLTGQDGRLCEAYWAYASTGDERAIDRAVEVAGPDLIDRARKALARRGLL